ncbi:hypothetical protein PoB_002619400, partial [Plakobranchus ocellatus]
MLSWLFYITSLKNEKGFRVERVQKIGDLRISGPPPGQGTDAGTRTRDTLRRSQGGFAIHFATKATISFRT